MTKYKTVHLKRNKTFNSSSQAMTYARHRYNRNIPKKHQFKTNKELSRNKAFKFKSLFKRIR